MAQYIKLDSANRLNAGTTSPGNFTLNCQKPLEGRYALKAIYFPATFFNINTDLNNRIYFTESATAKVATIPPGFYSGYSALMTAVETAMNTASGGTNTFVLTRSALTGLITITASSVNFTLTFGTNTTAAAREVLGFAAADSTVAALAQTGVAYPNLATVRSLNIDINNIGNFTNTQGTNSCTFCVPILQIVPGVGYYEPPITLPQVVEFRDRTASLKIRVIDDNGQVIPLQNEFYMLLAPSC